MQNLLIFPSFDCKTEKPLEGTPEVPFVYIDVKRDRETILSWIHESNLSRLQIEENAYPLKIVADAPAAHGQIPPKQSPRTSEAKSAGQTKTDSCQRYL